MNFDEAQSTLDSWPDWGVSSLVNTRPLTGHLADCRYPRAKEKAVLHFFEREVGFQGAGSPTRIKRKPDFYGRGAVLPLDMLDRFPVRGISRFRGGGLKRHDALESSVDLGEPTWLAGLRPASETMVPISKQADLLILTKGSFGFSNNPVEWIVAVSAIAHIELYFR